MKTVGYISYKTQLYRERGQKSKKTIYSLIIPGRHSSQFFIMDQNFGNITASEYLIG